MTLKLLSSIFIVALLIAGCKKEAGFQTALVGTWKLAEQYDGYLMGGNYTWNKVPSNCSGKLTFGARGEYSAFSNNSGKTCTGNYDLLGSNELQVTSSCNNAALVYSISAITVNLLILDCKVREGVVRCKYTK